jgi:DNA-binding transcriptional LysR family regulator
MARLDSMEAFARVAETGSFSEAARRLGSSKSAVSRQIAALETALGARLLYRTTRALTLTETGQRYYESVSRILGEIEEADRAVGQLQSTPRGILPVAAPVSFGLLHLAEALPAFLAQCPHVEMDVVTSDRFVDLIEEGFDLAIRLGRLLESSLVARKLAPMRSAICASPAYLAAHGTPDTPDALEGHSCLCYSNLSRAEEWRFVTAEGRPWRVEIKGRLRVNNGDLLRSAALAGLGIVNLPTFLIGPDIKAGRLVSLLDAHIPQDRGIYAVYPHARHLPAKTRVFIDFLAERFATPNWDA